MTTTITILGLGPGRWEDVTLRARACLERAERESFGHRGNCAGRWPTRRHSHNGLLALFPGI